MHCEASQNSPEGLVTSNQAESIVWTLQRVWRLTSDGWSNMPAAVCIHWVPMPGADLAWFDRVRTNPPFSLQQLTRWRVQAALKARNCSTLSSPQHLSAIKWVWSTKNGRGKCKNFRALRARITPEPPFSISWIRPCMHLTRLNPIQRAKSILERNTCTHALSCVSVCPCITSNIVFTVETNLYDTCLNWFPMYLYVFGIKSRQSASQIVKCCKANAARILM